MRRAYRALLVAYPKGFRRRHGEEMAWVFADQCRDERRSGGALALVLLGLRTVLDLAGTALAERGGTVGRGLAAAAVAVGKRGLTREPKSAWGGLSALAIGLSILTINVAAVALGGPLLEWWLPDLVLGGHLALLGAGRLMRPTSPPLTAALRSAARIAWCSFWALLAWRAHVDHGLLGVAGVALLLLVIVAADVLFFGRGPRRGAAFTQARGGDRPDGG